MKKLLALLLIAPFLLIVSCPQDNGGGTSGAVTGVTLNKDSMTLLVGKTATLTRTIIPANATNRAVRWSSSDDTKVTVAAGNPATITAVAIGEATITVTTVDGNKQAHCVVTVRAPGIEDIGGKDSLSGSSAKVYLEDKKAWIGWNLGNALDAPNEGTWTPVVNKNILKGVRDAGFKVIRVPVTWHSDNHPIGAAPNYLIDQDWLNRVGEVVDMAYDEGFVTVVNIHHDDNRWLSVRKAGANSTDRAAILAQYTKVWEQIADKFKDYGDWLIFEAFNEPHDGGWGWGAINATEFEVINEWNQTFTTTVRAAGGKNTERFLVLPGYCQKPHQYGPDIFTLPTDTAANKQIVAFHFYYPENFALRGDGTWGTLAEIDQITSSEQFGFKAMERFIDMDIPVIIGEMGPARAQTTTGDASRIEYISHVYKAAKDCGMIPVYWDNGKEARSDDTFGLFNRTTGQPFSDEHQEVIDAMIAAVE